MMLVFLRSLPAADLFRIGFLAFPSVCDVLQLAIARTRLGFVLVQLKGQHWAATDYDTTIVDAYVSPQ